MAYGEQFPTHTQAYDANQFHETLIELNKPDEDDVSDTVVVDVGTDSIGVTCSGDGRCGENSEQSLPVDQSAAAEVKHLPSTEAGADGMVEHDSGVGDRAVSTSPCDR